MSLESRHQNPDISSSVRTRLRASRRVAAGVACAALSVYFGALITQETVRQDLSSEEANGGIGSGIAAAAGAVYLLRPRK